MMVLAAFCASVAILLWLDRIKFVWLAVMGLAPGAWVSHDGPIWIGCGLMSVVLYIMGRSEGVDVSEREIRAALARFWQETAVLLSAGLTFWQAVEAALGFEPLLAEPLSEAVESLMHRSNTVPKSLQRLGVDGPLTGLLLQHGYRHGITPEHIKSHAQHLEDRLVYEAERKKRRDPIWLTILPALLLLNVLWLFLAPMVALAGHSWLKL